ncbi:hypothetical protein [Amycolatopsis sp. NPDC059657]|uniref:hypothetical protein n=1 Tax=Amycolatopsis sp. NPDC059657 TaxID=3346899 RepID=UPI00366C46B8
MGKKMWVAAVTGLGMGGVALVIVSVTGAFGGDANSGSQTCNVTGSNNVTCGQQVGPIQPSTPSVSTEPSTPQMTPQAATAPTDFLATYCAQWGRKPVLRTSTTDGWRCAKPGADDQSVSMDDICHLIRNSQSRALAADADDPRSWTCS